MNKKCKTKVNKLVFAFFTVVLLCGTAQASSKVIIKNEKDNAEVDITIEPGDGKLMTTDKNARRLILKPDEEKTLEIKKDELGKETFSIIGTVGTPSLYNSCKPLLIGKNYKIVFVAGKISGTICVMAEL